MNQEKEIAQIASTAGEYLAPKVRVTGLRRGRVLCASDGNTTRMTIAEERGNDDFE